MSDDSNVIRWYRAAPYLVVRSVFYTLPEHIRDRCYSRFNNFNDWYGLPESARCALRSHATMHYALND